MKKRIFITMLCFAAASAVLIGTAVFLSQQKDALEVKETILYGTPASAENIKLSLDTCYHTAARWNTEIPAGKAACAKTEFTREKWKNETMFSSQSWADISCYLSDSIDNESDPEFRTIPFETSQKMISDAAAKVSPGQRKDVFLKLKDYISDLSMEFSGEVSGYNLYTTPASDRQIAAAFPVAVPDEARIQVSVAKDSEGAVQDYSICGDYRLAGCSAVSSAGCYLAFNRLQLNTDSTVKEVSLPEGSAGAGIYFIPFKASDAHRALEPDPHKLRKVGSLSEEVTLLKLFESKDKKKLFLFTIEDKETVYFSVIDSKSGNLLQKTELGHASTYIDEAPWAEISFFVEKDDHILAGFDGYKTNLFLFKKTGNTYRLQSAHAVSEEVFSEDSPFRYTAAFTDFACDGSRLAVAAMSESCSASLLYFDRKELKFAAEYKLSASPGPHAENSAIYIEPQLLPSRENPIQVTLPETAERKEMAK